MHIGKRSDTQTARVKQWIAAFEPQESGRGLTSRYYKRLTSRHSTRCGYLPHFGDSLHATHIYSLHAPHLGYDVTPPLG